MIERIYGQHGAIFPRVRWLLKNLCIGVVALMSWLTPWLIIFLR